MPGLGEAPDQDLVAGLEEEDLGPDAAALEGAARGPVCGLGVARPDVEDDCHPGVAGEVRGHQVGEVR